MTTKDQYRANPQAYKDAARRYRLKNLEEVRRKSREFQRKKRSSNRALYNLYNNSYRHGADFARVWAEFWDAQEGKCYLCGDEMNPERAFIDHDHKCCPQRASCQYCRRGLACSRCNLLIGHAEDDPELLRCIADRLEAANADVTIRLSGKPEQLRLVV